MKKHVKYTRNICVVVFYDLPPICGYLRPNIYILDCNVIPFLRMNIAFFF